MTASQSNRRPTGDTIATVIMFALAAIAGALSVSYSFFTLHAEFVQFILLNKFKKNKS